MFHPLMILVYVAISLVVGLVIWFLLPSPSDEQVLADLRKAKARTQDRINEIEARMEDRDRLGEELDRSSERRN